MRRDKVYFVQDNKRCASRRSKIRAKVSKVYKVHPTEEALQIVVGTVGPVAVSIAVTDKFRHYREGNTIFAATMYICYYRSF